LSRWKQSHARQTPSRAAAAGCAWSIATGRPSDGPRGRSNPATSDHSRRFEAGYHPARLVGAILRPRLLPTALWINSPGHKIAITRQLTAPSVSMQLTSSAPGTTISSRRREPTMWGRAVVGFVLCAVGTVFILQGTKVIQGSGMSGQGKWAAIGAVVVVAGLACFAWAAKHHRNGTTEAN
jgi:hypothetical protein